MKCSEEGSKNDRARRNITNYHYHFWSHQNIPNGKHSCEMQEKIGGGGINPQTEGDIQWTRSNPLLLYWNVEFISNSIGLFIYNSWVDIMDRWEKEILLFGIIGSTASITSLIITIVWVLGFIGN